MLTGIAAISVSYTVHAEKTLKVAVGVTIPPYVIREEKRGIEYDILKEILASQGYRMEPVFVPLSRTLYLLRNKRVDGIMSTGQIDLPGCYTDHHITYWNYAISLSEKNYDIKSVKDLTDKRVVAFQNASEYLGYNYKKMTEKSKDYREIADQSAQVMQLFNKRADIIVGDRYIFEWYRKSDQVQEMSDVTQKVTYHEIFAPSMFAAVFQDYEICNKFNDGLKQLKESGRYQEIIESYGVMNTQQLN
ncbi:substrate-binding periplasmic protein [Curvivirga aplysinae]|uniref:substrate-binding periplasmic protein n=1 Tax=Curvivirga aplysinae TaxID=2529852 RepID=UPI001C3FE08E|nr:transporter substrate-binding domain-containing protein [Curvivirga aplysinae]